MTRWWRFISQAASESLALSYVFAVFISLAASLGSGGLGLRGEAAPFFLAFPAVFLASWRGGLGPGLVSVVVCSLSAILNSYLNERGQGTEESAVGAYFVVFAVFAVVMTVLNSRSVRGRSNRADFASHLAHDLRNPLGVILGFTELALEASAPGSGQREDLLRVRKGAEALRELIANILDLSKAEANKLVLERSEVSLAGLMKDIAADATPRAKEKNIDLRVRLASGVPGVITTDIARVRQILLNLIGLAIEGMDGGDLEIDVSKSEDAGSSRNLEFSVKAKGLNLTPERRGRLAQSLKPIDPSRAGRGGADWGLALSWQLARLLGGDLDIEESRPEKGTTFVFSIDAGEPPVASAPPLARELEGVRVLLVEDSPDNRLLVTRFLTLAGANVTSAENGQDGVERAVAAEYDVILMDIQMPVLDGFSALRDLRRRSVGTPVIALTAHDLREERERAFAAGFDDYVTKPIRREVLVQAVKAFAPAGPGRLPS